MTKTFRFIGMVLMAVLMSAGFAACSPSDIVDEIDILENDEAQKFVGTWHASGHYWYFAKNGDLYVGEDSNVT